jgi:hypothetical protein
LVTVLVVTVRAGTAAGLAAMCVVRVAVDVRRWVDVAFAAVLTGADSVALVSLATGAVSVVAGGETSAVGGGLVVVTGEGCVGWTSWASSGVEESARAAAIAGRALACAYFVALIIIKNNRAPGS